MYLFYCFKTFSSIFNFRENVFSEAEFKELELLLKHGWFHLKLYYSFKISAGAQLKPVFGGFETRFKFIKFGLRQDYCPSLAARIENVFGPSFSEKLINPQKFIKRPFNSVFKEIKNKELILDYFFEIKTNSQMILCFKLKFSNSKYLRFLYWGFENRWQRKTRQREQKICQIRFCYFLNCQKEDESETIALIFFHIKIRKNNGVFLNLSNLKLLIDCIS